MKYTLLIAIILLPIISSGQKLLKPEIDKLTEDTTLKTSKEKLCIDGNYLFGYGKTLEFWIEKTKRNYYLILYVQTVNTESKFSIIAGDKTYLKLSDKSIITLTTNTTQPADVNRFKAGSSTYHQCEMTIPYMLSEDDIAKLKATPITFIRIEMKRENFDYDIKPKNAARLTKALALIAPHI